MKTILKAVIACLLMPLLYSSQTTTEETDKKPERLFTTEARFDWGITAGASYGLAEIGNLGRLRNQVITGKSITGFQAGFFVQPQSDIFYVKPAILYSAASGDVSDERTTVFKIQKIEMPLLFGVRVYRQWCVEGGPVLSRILSVTEQYHPFGTVSLGRNGLGYHAALAYDNNIFILKAAIQGVTYEAPGLMQSFRERNQLVLSAAYKFSNGFPEMSMGTKKFRKVYIPQGRKKIRINYFRR
jgi:hypothetical protein